MKKVLLAVLLSISIPALAGGLDGGTATSVNSDSVAVGPDSYAVGQQSTAVGFGAVAAQPGVSGPANLATTVGASSSAMGDRATAVGWAATATSNSTALGAAAHSSADGAVAIGSSSIADQANTVSFGRSSTQEPGLPPITRRLVNVADGINATDAATVGQLNAAISGLSGGTIDTTARASAATAQSTADVASATAGTALTTAVAADSKASTALATANQTRSDLNNFANQTSSRFTALDQRMGEMGKEYRAGIAGSIAGTHALVAAVRTNSLGIGLGTFGGQTAISVGLATQLRQAQVTASLSHSGGETGAGVGFSLPIF